MKLNKIALAVGAAVLGLSSVAQAELSANIGATSNYVWRGVTQTSDDAAISGGIDYAHESGVYVGTWISTLGNGGGEEIDFYAGFGGEAGDIGYDIGVIYYAYPSGQDLDFTEIYGSLSFGPATAGIAYTIDTEAGGDDDHVYYYLSAGHDLDDGWSIGATVGHYDMDGTGNDYSHAQLDITKSAGDYGDFTLSLSNVFDQDTNALDNDLVPFVSWSKGF